MLSDIMTPPLAKVLYVEDQPAVASVVQLELAEAGIAVTSVTNGEQCLALARENQFDVILLDQLLPKMDGIEICRRLKSDAALKGIPVIFFTAYPNRFHEREARKMGAADYLHKGGSEAHLAKRILTQVGQAQGRPAPPPAKPTPTPQPPAAPSWLKSVLKRP